MDFETMYQAMDSRDRRFDGRFFVGVRTTGVYCRPICPAPTPRRRNTRFFRYAAVAELAGFRACRRCHPEASPDAPEWDTRADLVGRALRLIADGLVDTRGVAGLARRLDVSERHLQRVFKADVGATPGVVARSRRARLARQLLSETAMPVTRVAFAAGFSSVRAFNETVRQFYRLTPSEIRRGSTPPGSLHLRLRYRAPLGVEELMGFLGVNAVPGVEEVTARSYRRLIAFGRKPALIELTPTDHDVGLSIHSDEVGALAPVVQSCRRLMDLDADPLVIDEHLARSPALRGLVERRPGVRLPGSYDAMQVAVVAILSQRASLRNACRTAGRIAEYLGTAIPHPLGSLRYVFPTPDRLAEADLETAGVSPTNARAIRSVAAAIVDGSLAVDGSMDPAVAMRALGAVDGLGGRALSVIAARALRDPDSFPVCLLDTPLPFPPSTTADQWHPWRGYAFMHLWADRSVRSNGSGPEGPSDGHLRPRRNRADTSSAA